jgi:hypothetical protein
VHACRCMYTVHSNLSSSTTHPWQMSLVRDPQKMCLSATRTALQMHGGPTPESQVCCQHMA